MSGARATVYALRLLDMEDGEANTLAVIHGEDRALMLSKARQAVEDGMWSQVFDVSHEPARLVAQFGPCLGHEPAPGSGAPMGIEVFCDGSCRVVLERTRAAVCRGCEWGCGECDARQVRQSDRERFGGRS